MNRNGPNAPSNTDEDGEVEPREDGAAEALARALAASSKGVSSLGASSLGAAARDTTDGQSSLGGPLQEDHSAKELADWGRRTAAVVRQGDAAGTRSRDHAAGESMLASVRARLAAEAAEPGAARHGKGPTVLQLVARSPLLRLVAASLMAHLLALPVLAWFTFRPNPEPQLHVRIEAPTDRARDFAPEPEVLEPKHATWEWEQRRRLERFALARANRRGALERLRPRAEERAEAEAAGGWRAALLARIDLWLGEAPRQAAPDVAALDGGSAALWLGAELDRALLGRDEGALGALETELAQLAARPDPGPLAMGLVQRARSLGLGVGPEDWPPPDQEPFDPAALFEEVIQTWSSEAAGFGPLVRWRATAPR